MKKYFFCIIFLYCFAPAISQRMTKEQYVELYKDFAIREMKRMGIPASITLAQGILEAESGNSDLVKKSNNHFGIKPMIKIIPINCGRCCSATVGKRSSPFVTIPLADAYK